MIKSNLLKQFKTHLFIEFFYRYDKGLIYEQRDKSNKYILLEKYGVFNECDKIVNKIWKIIENNKNLDEFNIICNNDLISKIKIVLTNESGALFSPYDSIIENNKYKMLYIEINKYDAHIKNECIPLLMHELTHAYQSLSYYNKYNQTFVDKIINDKYYNIINGDNEGNYYLKNLQKIFYYIYGFEKGAYIAQMNGYIKTINRRFTNINQISDFLKNTVVYQNYETIIEWIEEISKINNVKQKDIILAYVNANSRYNFKTFNQLKKWLNYNSFKIQQKFNKIIPKIAYDTLNITRSVDFNPQTKLLKNEKEK